MFVLVGLVASSLEGARATTVATGGGAPVRTVAGSVGSGLATRVVQVPTDVLVKGDTLYVADTLYNVVRGIDLTTGQERVFAGTGRRGFSGDGGPATSADLYRPTALATDGNGSVYVADMDNHRVRRIAPSGEISTVASLIWPRAIALDTAGNLYVSGHEERVWRIDPSGTRTLFAGVGGSSGNAGDGGPATAAHLSSVNGLAADRTGNIYLASGNRIRRVDRSGTTITTYTGGGEEYGREGVATAQAIGPSRLAFDDSTGNLYFSDWRWVRRVDPLGFLWTVAGNGEFTLTGPHGQEADPGDGQQARTVPVGAEGLSVDGRGKLYLGEPGRGRARRSARGIRRGHRPCTGGHRPAPIDVVDPAGHNTPRRRGQLAGDRQRSSGGTRPIRPRLHLCPPARLLGRAGGECLVGLITGPAGKLAFFSARGPDGAAHDVAVPLPWTAGRYYFPFVYQLSPGV